MNSKRPPIIEPKCNQLNCQGLITVASPSPASFFGKQKSGSNYANQFGVALRGLRMSVCVCACGCTHRVQTHLAMHDLALNDGTGEVASAAGTAVATVLAV